MPKTTEPTKSLRDWPVPPATLSCAEAGAVLGFSPRYVSNAVAAGEIRAVSNADGDPVRPFRIPIGTVAVLLGFGPDEPAAAAAMIAAYWPKSEAA